MSKKPKPEAVVRSALQLLELAGKDREVLEPRLPAGTLSGLQADADGLRIEAPGAVAARQLTMAATATLESTATTLAAQVQGIRTASRRARLDAAVLRAVGVGRRLHATVVSSVVEAAALVEQAFGEYPDALRSAGVLLADIERVAALRDRLRSMNEAQELGKVSSKEKTASRNLMKRRTLEAMGRILAAAELAFLDQPERLALYRAALPK
ncbi:MAG: hypothetical protein CVU59_09005 [Deltaproteobacteria bacterium HGW-Deltaproteobacteria-17]|nr:MAG: hypothetical protein CVU59_09005 [Deltaproteobacteria bacterium HGW-Deltaproteobacteria-17]